MLPASAYPGPASSARSGLGVSRTAIQAVFSRQAFALQFEAPREGSGTPRITGSVPGKLIVLNLAGPPEDLSERSHVNHRRAQHQPAITACCARSARREREVSSRSTTAGDTGLERRRQVAEYAVAKLR